MGGGTDGILIVEVTNNTLNKTWQEIHDSIMQGKIPVVFDYTNARGPFIDFVMGTDTATGYAVVTYSNIAYNAESPSSYPINRNPV